MEALPIIPNPLAAFPTPPIPEPLCATVSLPRFNNPSAFVPAFGVIIPEIFPPMPSPIRPPSICIAERIPVNADSAIIDLLRASVNLFTGSIIDEAILAAIKPPDTAPVAIPGI